MAGRSTGSRAPLSRCTVPPISRVTPGIRFSKGTEPPRRQTTARPARRQALLPVRGGVAPPVLPALATAHSLQRRGRSVGVRQLRSEVASKSPFGAEFGIKKSEDLRGQ